MFLFLFFSIFSISFFFLYRGYNSKYIGDVIATLDQEVFVG